MSRLALISSIALVLGMAGCAKNQNQQTALQTTAPAKPLVALVPVIDNAKNEQCEWNLSEEFTSSFYASLGQGPLSLEDAAKVRVVVKKCNESMNPFGTNTAWIKEIFQAQRYVVFLELIKHEEVLKQARKKQGDPKMCPADLNMSMRIRIFDLQGEKPKIVLQEIVSNSHFIPRQFTTVNFHQVPWGDEGFHFSPLGLAHMQFIKEISLRIEDYIMLSEKSPH